MSEPVEIVWDASQYGVVIAMKMTTIMPSWASAAGNAEAAVNDICNDYFTAEIWNDQRGPDDDRWDIQVEVYSPSEIAGEFDVRLERKIVASAKKRPEQQQENEL